MSEILITCPHCGFQKKIPENKLPHKPVKATCPSCKKIFMINKSSEAKASQKTHEKKPAPPPLPRQPLKSAPAPLSRSTSDIPADSEEPVPATSQAEALSKKRLQVAMVVLFLITVLLAPLRIWFSNQAISTPYPNRLSASAHGLVVLYGNEFHVADYNGNIQWSQKLPDQTKPYQILWQDEEVWIADSKTDRILEFSNNNMTEVVLKGPGISDQFNVAVGLLDRKLYVTDSRNHKVKIYNQDGEYLDEFGKQGFSDGAFFWPKDIVFDDQGQLIIGNTLRSGVDIFKTDGTYVKTLVKHSGNPLQTIKDTPPEKLKDIPLQALKDSLMPQFIADFVIDNQSLVTIECNQLVTECKIVSYDPEGKIQKSIPHYPSTETAGDIAMWQGKLYVCNCLKRNVDVYQAATLEYIGAFSRQIDDFGVKSSRKEALYRTFSKVFLIIMLLNLSLIMWIFYRLKRS